MLPILMSLRRDPEIDLVLLVSGGHLVPGQGMTVDEIERDGFAVGNRVDMVLAGDGPTAIAKSFGLGVISFADELARIEPDVLLVPGDRYEALAVAIAALPREIVIAHLGGGQLTYGVMDERIRHALSKMAHIHFVLTKDDHDRLVRMGEDPAHIHQIPARLLSTANPDHLVDRAELSRALGVSLRPPVLAITYHPVTNDEHESTNGLEALLAALDDHQTATLVFTAPNVDHGGQAILRRIDEYVQKNRERAVLVPSLGRDRYTSLIACSSAVVGNSSSGLIDAPVVGTPTVNVGSRQAGRDRADSVIDCPAEATSISEAISRACGRRIEVPRNSGRTDEMDLEGLVLPPLKQASYSQFRHKPFFEQNNGGMTR
jgi:UDP-hydrolysing UDP-N-acetyl-D-glucosamine 2-epimerase